MNRPVAFASYRIDRPGQDVSVTPNHYGETPSEFHRRESPCWYQPEQWRTRAATHGEVRRSRGECASDAAVEAVAGC
jgi:hypothetical protein